MSSLQIARKTSGKRRLKDLLLQQVNRICADCRAPDPKWASENIGVFICSKCSGAHRSLGSHISKVMSVTLDEWSDDEIDAMIEVGGNSSANAIYEANIPEGCTNPGPDASHDLRAKFILSKYELKEFMTPSLRTVSTKNGNSSTLSRFSQRVINNFRSTNGSQKMKAQTTIIKSNLNSVWNKELMLSFPQNSGLLKLQVYDYDMFSTDDIMGEAEIDLQPLINSALACGDKGMFGDMQIGKWLKSHDNPLMDDSIVNIIDGKVKQGMSIKLQNVESEELYLELQWITLERIEVSEDDQEIS